MAWSASAIFRQMVTHAFDRTEVFDLDTDSFKAALFNDSITPDKDSALTGYDEGGGQWVASVNEVVDSSGGGTDWPAGGRPLVNPDVSNPATGVIMFDADNTASAGATADIASAMGVLVYDDTLTTPDDPGVSYNWFGTAQSVTNGTFTVVWHGNGILRITV
jgi:hypothetical protein